MASPYDFKVKDSHGKSVGLDRYKGKVMLIVNTASQCGFTPQYKGLERAINRDRRQPLSVLILIAHQHGLRVSEAVASPAALQAEESGVPKLGIARCSANQAISARSARIVCASRLCAPWERGRISDKGETTMHGESLHPLALKAKLKRVVEEALASVSAPGAQPRKPATSTRNYRR